MSETLVIELKEGAVTGGRPPVPPYAPPGGGAGPAPGANAGPGPQRPPAATFDPHAEALKQIERERQRALVKAEYDKLKPPAHTPPPAPAANNASFWAAGAAALRSAYDIGSRGMAGVARGPGANPVGSLLGGAASAVDGATSAVSGIASAIPVAGPAVSAAVSALGATVSASVKALKAFVDSVDESARHLGQFNSQIGYAQQMAEVRKTLGDLRRANYLAPEMAAYTEAKSRLSEGWEDLKASLQKTFLPLLTKVVEFLADAVEYLQDMPAKIGNFFIDAANAQIKVLQDLYNKLPGPDVHFKLLERIELNTRKKNDDDLGRFTGELLRAVVPVPPRQAAPAQPGPRFPVLGGL